MNLCLWCIRFFSHLHAAQIPQFKKRLNIEHFALNKSYLRTPVQSTWNAMWLEQVQCGKCSYPSSLDLTPTGSSFRRPSFWVEATVENHPNKKYWNLKKEASRKYLGISGLRRCEVFDEQWYGKWHFIFSNQMLLAAVIQFSQTHNCPVTAGRKKCPSSAALYNSFICVKEASRM